MLQLFWVFIVYWIVLGCLNPYLLCCPGVAQPVWYSAESHWLESHLYIGQPFFSFEKRIVLGVAYLFGLPLPRDLVVDTRITRGHVHLNFILLSAQSPQTCLQSSCQRHWMPFWVTMLLTHWPQSVSLPVPGYSVWWNMHLATPVWRYIHDGTLVKKENAQ